MFIENLKNDVMVKENVKPKSQIEFFINKSAKEFNNDTKIYRYMDFDCFLQILDKKFYISAKKHFSDCYDAGTKVPLKDIFKNFVNVCEGKSVVLNIYRIDRNVQEVTKLSYLLLDFEQR